jgi:hypothetical protein
MYAAVNKELCEKMMNELEGMLSLQFEMNNTLIEVEKHKQEQNLYWCEIYIQRIVTKTTH